MTADAQACWAGSVSRRIDEDESTLDTRLLEREQSSERAAYEQMLSDERFALVDHLAAPPAVADVRATSRRSAW